MSYQKAPHDPYSPPGYPPSAPPPPPYEGYPPPPHEGYPPPPPPLQGIQDTHHRDHHLQGIQDTHHRVHRVGTKGISLKGIQRLQVRHSTSSVIIMNTTLTRKIMVVAPRYYVDVWPHFVAVVCWRSAASKIWLLH
ncbi:uncharacterized protein [Populus alba]|uniref:uncharacterized protein isoform X2 n=1 Tax=Populus alba TaxID=43335 RepID=UPI0015892152|nr:wiskott-Aldrich syndrome protein family member 2-like isoform X1 [Populus alba]